MPDQYDLAGCELLSGLDAQVSEIVEVVGDCLPTWSRDEWARLVARGVTSELQILMARHWESLEGQPRACSKVLLEFGVLELFLGNFSVVKEGVG